MVLGVDLSEFKSTKKVVPRARENLEVNIITS
jgi:hypothetical protein